MFDQLNIEPITKHTEFFYDEQKLSLYYNYNFCKSIDLTITYDMKSMNIYMYVHAYVMYVDVCMHASVCLCMYLSMYMWTC